MSDAFPNPSAVCGTLYGVGLGPGDPDLMSVRADRLIRQARYVAFFRKAGHPGHARSIAAGILPADVCEIPLEYPVTTEIPVQHPAYNALLAAFYAECADSLRQILRKGQDVIVLSEGDPFFYGSFMHLYSRLRNDVPIEVVPAITGMSAAWTASREPITWGDDLLSVVMGTLPEEKMITAMQAADALVVMKIGRNMAKIRRALDATGKSANAVFVEYASMGAQRVMALADMPLDNRTPYFSIIIVHGQGRRP